MVDEVAWGVGWGREGDEVVVGGSDDEGDQAFGVGGEKNGTNGVPPPPPPPHHPYASAADAEQPARYGATSSEEPKTQTKMKGANGNASADAFLYDTHSTRSVIEECGTRSSAHPVTFVDEPEGVEVEDDDLYACFEDTEEEVEEEAEEEDFREARGRGRKGLPVPIPRTP